MPAREPRTDLPTHTVENQPPPLCDYNLYDRDAAPREGRLSVESPMATALLGRAPGDELSVTLPRGTRALTVLSVS